MYVAALDTSASQGAFAVLTAETYEVVSTGTDLETGRRSAGLFARMLAILYRAGVTLAQIEAWRVGMGPGSFTGVRAGAALVLGAGQGTGAQVQGMPTALAAARAAGVEGPFFCLADGRRGEALVTPGAVDPNGRIQTGESFATRIESLADQEGVAVVLTQDPIADAVETLLAERCLRIPHLDVSGFWQQGDQPAHDEELKPVYVRPAVFVAPKPARLVDG